MENESAVWTEKYRPKEFSEVKGQNDIAERIAAFVSVRNMPHLLFSGPAGTGKSSLSLIAVKKLFGPGWRDNYLELNASDERGIDVVRQKVKNFARTRPLGDVNFKIIFLDEADALTREAQQALRRTMENYTNTCRFILSCNYLSKIIEPIQSRCAVFRFKLLDKKTISEIITSISGKENLVINEAAIDALYTYGEGDCRRIVNMLQAASAVSKNITQEVVFEIASSANPKDIRAMLEIALSGNFPAARDKLRDLVFRQGLSGMDIIKTLQKEIWNIDIPDFLKIKLTEKIGDTEFRLVEGADECIQLESFLAAATVLK